MTVGDDWPRWDALCLAETRVGGMIARITVEWVGLVAPTAMAATNVATQWSVDVLVTRTRPRPRILAVGVEPARPAEPRGML